MDSIQSGISNPPLIHPSHSIPLGSAADYALPAHPGQSSQNIPSLLFLPPMQAQPDAGSRSKQQRFAQVCEDELQSLSEHKGSKHKHTHLQTAWAVRIMKGMDYDRV